jgi:hypothetical protein
MLLMPGVVLTIMAYLGVICPNWWTYFIATSMCSWLTNKFILKYLPVMPEDNPMAFGLIWGTKFIIFVTLFGSYIPSKVCFRIIVLSYRVMIKFCYN